MTSAQDVVEMALKDVGYVEGPNNDNKFGRWYGMNNAPYCAMAVSYWFYMAGMPLPITTPKGFAYCPYGVKYFSDHGQTVESMHMFRPGDIVFYDWDGDGVSDHVELVVSGDTFTTIGANTSPQNVSGSQSNGGGVYVRRRATSAIEAVARVDFGAHNPNETVAPAWPGRYILLASPLMHGNDVATWQRQMRSRGWSITVDGYYGPQSDKVCQAFQSEKALARDGVIGPLTWMASWDIPVTN